MSEEDSGTAKIVVTRDGSHTVYSSRFDQHYHNPNGAIAESRYVFFEKTNLIDALSERDHITILEIGFGTGLSLLLLMDYYLSQNSTADIDFYTVEGFPLDAESAKKFNYREQLDHPELADHLEDIFRNLSDGMNKFALTDHISLHLFKGMFRDFASQNFQIAANFVFHDAFSPDANPDLWTGEVFKQIRDFCADDAIFSTYSAASIAQGALSWAGWHVAKTEGALGKREMIVAALDSDQLSGLDRINEERYARRYEQGDFD